MIRRSLLIVAKALSFAAIASAAVLPTGQSLLSPDLNALRFGARTAGDASREIVSVTGQPFRQAIRVSTVKKPVYPYHVTLTAPTRAAIGKGDAVLVSFVARRIETRQETGEAQVGVVVEQTSGDYHKLLDTLISVGPQWTRVDAPFLSDGDYPAGNAHLSLRFGFESQVVEIATVTLTNFGRNVSLKALPRSTQMYAGWEANAAWRKPAAERIEKIRKGDLTVSVSEAGKPIAGAKVHARMTRHEFAFGSAVVAGRIVDTKSPDNERYRQIIEQHFNKVVFENDLKWNGWLTNGARGLEHRNQTLQAIDWLHARNIAIRGHVMVWPGWRNLPRFVADAKNDPAALRRIVDEHITDQTAVLRGKLNEWDVINEVYANHDLPDILGRKEMAHWFQLARQGDPQVKLFYNDYIMFRGHGPGSPNQFFYDIVKFLKENGPIDGIGEQGHFGGSPTPPVEVLKAFDQFAALGLPIQISEFDVDTSDEELQAAYTRDFMTAAFSHPSLIGIVMWGFWEGAHWKPRAALWSKDWTLRPNGKVWLDLVTKEWWTNADAVTDASGTCRIRGFCGDYEVTVAPSTGTRTNKVHLSRDGAAVRF